MVRKPAPAAAATTKSAVEPNSKAASPPLPDRKPAPVQTRWEGDVVEIPTHVHVINTGTYPENGNLSDTPIEQQINQLNKTYEPYGFKFKLESTRRITNPAWYNPGLFTETREGYEEHWRQMIRQLRQGGPDHLNLFVHRPAPGLLGKAEFPWLARENPKDDAVLLNNRTLPGSGVAGIDLGNTAVHEVGHWLGLYHTFQSGCDAPGDEISDTPAEGKPNVGMGQNKDSCALEPGLDPIHNYMDYSDDPLTTEFTPEQMQRMHQHWDAYRKPGSEFRWVESGTVNLKIKDRKSVESTLRIDADLRPGSMKLMFDIQDTTPKDRLLGSDDPRKGTAHDAPEDLRITLRSPSGKEVVILDRVAADLEWPMIELSKYFPNETTKGEWTLRVEDTKANTEEGKLTAWQLSAGGQKK